MILRDKCYIIKLKQEKVLTNNTQCYVFVTLGVDKMKHMEYNYNRKDD